MAFLNGLFANPFMALVGIMQFVAVAYSFYQGDWRIGVVNASVGLANFVLATVRA